MGSQERKAREKAEHRKQRETLILAKAEELFLQKGFLDTKIGEIASACELTNGALYLYYKNKDHLVLKVMTGICLHFGDLLENEVKKNRNLNGWEQLRELLFVYNHTFKNNRNYHLLDAQFNLMFSHSYPNTPLVEDYFRSNTRVLMIFQTTITTGIRDGSITSNLSPERTAGMILNGINAYVEKISLRKTLMEAEQGIELEEELKNFLTFITDSLKG